MGEYCRSIDLYIDGSLLTFAYLPRCQGTDVLNLQKWAAIPAPAEVPAPVGVPAPVEALGSLEDPETSKQDTVAWHPNWIVSKCMEMPFVQHDNLFCHNSGV